MGAPAVKTKEIPSPSQVVAQRWISLVEFAIAVKAYIIEGLSKNQTEFKGCYSEQVWSLLKPDFKEKGWEIEDCGLTFKLRPVDPDDQPEMKEKEDNDNEKSTRA